MNRTPRQTKIRRALLRSLAEAAPYLLPESTLRADARRLVVPAPTAAELDEEIRQADNARMIVGVPGEEEIRWQLADGGSAWLLQNP